MCFLTSSTGWYWRPSYLVDKMEIRGPSNLHTFLLIISSLDCLYTNTAYLEVNFRVDVIKPGKTLEIPITFYPRESINYRELIPFEINGLSQQVIEIKGKGTEMKVQGSWGDPQQWQPCLFALPATFAPPTLPSPPVLPPSCVVRGQPVPPKDDLSNLTPVNHRPYSIPNFTLS